VILNLKERKRKKEMKNPLKKILLLLYAYLRTIHVKAWKQTLRFVYDTRAESAAGKFVGMAIGVIISVLMLPPVADTVLGVNTTGWTFTGAEGCKALMYIIPMIYIACVIIHIVKTSLE
jgi:hypothetical protein